MNPVEVAKYLRCFQRAVRTGRVHSRQIRRDGRYDHSVAELIRAVLPRDLYQMPRRRQGYELVWQGSQERLDQLRALLPQRLVTLRRIARQHERHFLASPYDALLDEAVEALPILLQFQRGETGATPPPPPELGPEGDGGVDLDDRNQGEAAVGTDLDELLEEQEQVAPIPVTPVVPPAEITAAMAEAARARAERVPTNVEFETEGARRFAEEVARVTRGR
jgi:hypothetical protein